MNFSDKLNNKPKKNIFVLATPFQLFIAENMINNIDEFRNVENILLFEKQYNLSFSRDCWSSVYTLADIGYSPIGIQKKNAAKKNLSLLLSFCGPHPQSTRILFSCIHYSFINFLFFDLDIRRNCTFAIIMDGIGSFTHEKISTFNFLRGLVKFTAGYLGLGIKYRPYLGNLLGDHFQIIHSVYAFQSQYLSCDEMKRVEVPLSCGRSDLLSASNSCIFLDQNNYENLFGHKIWNQMFTIAIDYIKNQKFDMLYYKAHPSGKLRPTDLQYLRLNGFHLIEQNECIEKLFPLLNVGVVVSFTSTSLFMLKSLYGDAVRCISLLDRINHIAPLPVPAYTQLKKVYQIVNVELC